MTGWLRRLFGNKKEHCPVRFEGQDGLFGTAVKPLMEDLLRGQGNLVVALYIEIPSRAANALTLQDMAKAGAVELDCAGYERKIVPAKEVRIELTRDGRPYRASIPDQSWKLGPGSDVELRWLVVAYKRGQLSAEMPLTWHRFRVTVWSMEDGLDITAQFNRDGFWFDGTRYFGEAA